MIRKNPSLKKTIEAFTDPQLLSHFYRRVRELSYNDDEAALQKRSEQILYGITYDEMQEEINMKEQLMGKLSNQLEGIKKQ